jgi:hypothetical protein
MTVYLIFLSGFVAGIAAFVLYSVGICWWLTKDPE